jgi:hypothetical protein
MVPLRRDIIPADRDQLALIAKTLDSWRDRRHLAANIQMRLA